MALLTRRQFLRLLAMSPGVAGLAWPVPAPAAGGPGRETRFVVNGRQVAFAAGGKASLLDFLRWDLGLKGSKYACGSGVCGACTVLINGRAIRSCVVDPAHLSGLRVTTIEGLGGPESLHHIQETFARLNVFQCGYCAPGFVMTTAALLATQARPDEPAIRRALYGNLCRCTGYQGIVQAVRACHDPDYLNHLARPRGYGLAGGDRLAAAKVSGTLSYAQDLEAPGQLHAKVVWSQQAHAKVLGLDASQALATPGVLRVITHVDIPGRKGFGPVMQDQPVLVSERVRFLGEAMAVVVARSPQAAELGAERVKVAYEPLPGVFSPQEALAPGAPQLTGQGNLCHQASCSKGDLAQGRARAQVIVKGDYRTPWTDPAFLEPEACLCSVAPDGALEVATAGQATISYRDQIAAICGLPLDKVRLRSQVAGGAFGARGDMSVQHLCALATLLTGRPVRLALSRAESMRVHVKRHPFTLHYEAGADSQGRLTHCLVRGLADAGAYHSATLPVVENAAAFATGPYEIPNLQVEIKAAFTNNPTCGAMRGFGVPQVALAMERQMDRLARRLGQDPVQFRLNNALKQGRVTQWGQVMGPEVGVVDCLEAVARAGQGLKARLRAGPDEALGVGYACAYKNTSTPTHLPFGWADVTLLLDHRGMIEIHTGGCEIGQGLVSALGQIAAQALGLPLERFQVVFGSSSQTSSPMLTSGSQQVFLSGGAVWRAAPRFGRLMLEAAAKLSKRPLKSLELSGQGVRLKGREQVLLSYEQLAWQARLKGLKLRLHYSYTPPVKTMDPPQRVVKIGPEQRILPSMGYVAQAVALALNRKTGQVRVLKVIAAQDVGKAINQDGVRGQIEGGVVMGLGWALGEDLGLRQGRVVNDSFERYFIPRTLDAPEIEVSIIERADPLGPLGAKGVGEVPVLPTAPALLAAIEDAVGVDLSELPVRAESLRDLLKDRPS